MAECVILIGLPASGKSSFYRERFSGTHDHVSKDLLRNSRRPRERQEQLLTASLAEGRSAVVDNTNPTAADRAPLVAIARRAGAAVIGYVFETDAADAVRRNRGRTGRARVPDVAIYACRQRLEPPSYAEGFDRLYAVTLDEAEHRFQVRPLPEP